MINLSDNQRATRDASERRRRDFSVAAGTMSRKQADNAARIAQLREEMGVAGTTDYFVRPGVVNPYIGQRLEQLQDDPEQYVAFQKAAQETKKANYSPGAPFTHGVPGGSQWANFDDYFGLQKKAAGYLGGRFNVGSISGGGDLNERTDGEPTRQLNAAPGLSTVPGDPGTDIYTGRSLRATPTRSRSVDALSGGGGGNGMTEMELYGLSRNPSPLARQMMARTRMLEQDADLGDMDIEDRAFRGPGSQAAVDEEFGAAGRANQRGAMSEIAKARTFFDPLVKRQRDVTQSQAIERSTAPALAQGALSIDKAGIERDARVEAARVTAAGRRESDGKMLQNWMNEITKAAKSGVFGVDRRGVPNPPPQELIDAATRTFASGMSGGAGGGVPEWVPPDLAGQYQEARQTINPRTGQPYSDEEIQAFLAGQ